MRSEEKGPSRVHWCELVDVHQGEIYSYVYRMVHDHAVAADLTQEIFVRIFTRFHSYDPARPLRSWIYAVATNVAYSHFRRERLHREKEREIAISREGRVDG